MTTLTRDQVRAVLLGLAEHSSGTATDQARLAGVGAMADALTTTRPVDPDLAELREHLARFVNRDCLRDHRVTDEDSALLMDQLQRMHADLSAERDRFRDQLTALLDLDPWTPDEAITEAAAARAAQQAQQRAAAKTHALTTPPGVGVAQALAILDTRRARDDVERLALDQIRTCVDDLDRRLVDASRRLDTVRGLHDRCVTRPDDSTAYCSTCSDEDGDPAEWPCPTIEALDAQP